MLSFLKEIDKPYLIITAASVVLGWFLVFLAAVLEEDRKLREVSKPDVILSNGIEISRRELRLKGLKCELGVVLNFDNENIIDKNGKAMGCK